MTITDLYEEIVSQYGKDAIVSPNSAYNVCELDDKFYIKFYDQDDFGEINYVRRT